MPLKILKFDCAQTECPAHSTRQCVPATAFFKGHDADTSKPVDIAIIGMRPSEIDIKAGKPFQSHGSEIVARMLDGIEPTLTFAATSVVRCRSKNQDGSPREPTDEIEFCTDHLLRDLKALRPKLLVIQGADTFKALVPTHVGRTYYGRYYDVVLGGRTYPAVLIEAPNVVIRNTSLLFHMFEGLTKAVDIAMHGEKSMYHPSRWVATPEIVYCDTVDKVKQMVKYLLHETNSKQTCSFDVETRNLNARYGNNLIMLQFCVNPRERVWVVPYHYTYGPFMDDDLEAVKKELKKLFTETPGFKYWLTFAGIFEQLQVMSFITDGMSFKNRPMIDVLGYTYLADENGVSFRKVIGQGLTLKEITPSLIGRDTYDLGVLEARKAGELYKLPAEKLVPYAADDVINTSLLYEYHSMVQKACGYKKSADKLLEHLFAGTYRLFAKIKRNGFFTDLDHLRLLASRDSPILKRMAEIESITLDNPNVKLASKKIAHVRSGGQTALFSTPTPFELNKPDHRVTLFFDIMKIKPLPAKKGKKTDTPSVDKTFYETYRDAFPEVKLFQEYFSLKKLATSYTNNVISYVDPNYTSHDPDWTNVDCSTDQRIRADFGFTNTVTGRPSVQNPNIQNVPRAENAAKAAIKSMYCAQQSYGAWRPGRKVERILMQLDYMANEVRWWAILSGDKVLADALRRGKLARDTYRKAPTKELKDAAEAAGDIHSQTAALMFGDLFLKADKAGRKSLRQVTKAIVFALIYGGGANLIAQRTGKEVAEVERLMGVFSKSFPRGAAWLKQIENIARENYYVESPIGRRRRLMEFVTDLHTEQAAAARYARNAPIQGVASDATLIGAQIWLDYIEDNKKDWLITNIVHDSCVTEIPIDDIEEATEVAERCFTTLMMNRITEVWGVEFICPLEVEFEYGVRWGDMSKWDFSTDHLQQIKKWLREGGLGGKHD